MTHSGKFLATDLKSDKNQITLYYYLVFVVLGSVRALIGPTLVDLADNTGVGIEEISSLLTIIALGNLFGVSQGGRLYDNLPGHPVLRISMVCMALTVVAIPLVVDFWYLLLILLILGIAEGIIDTGVNTMLIWLHGNFLGPYLNGLHFSYGFGALFSPIIIAQVVLFFGDFSSAYWISAIMVIPVMLLIGRIQSPRTNRVESHEEHPSFIKITWKEILPFPLFFLFYSGAEVSFSSWIYTYALRMHLSNITTAAYLTSFFWATFTLGRLAAIPISARLRPMMILLINLSGSFVSLLLLVLWPFSSQVLWLGTGLLGFFMASIFPTMMNMAGRKIPITGKITGTLFSGAGIGSMLLPWMVGQLFEIIDPHAAITVILYSIVVSFAIFLYLWLGSRKRMV